MAPVDPALETQLKHSLAYIDCVVVAVLAIRIAQQLADGEEPNWMAAGCLHEWALAAKAFSADDRSFFEKARIRREVAKLTEKH